MKPIYISDNDYFRWQYNGNEYVLHIQQDSDSEDPRTLYDHDTLMACFHPRYRLGDTIYQTEPEAFWQGLVRKYVPEATLFNKANAKPDEIPDRYTWEDNDGTVYGNLTSWKVCLYYVEDLTIPQCQSLLYPYLVSLPLWLYDHGGITIGCGDLVYPYDDRWDSGLVGWIVYARQAEDGENWCENAYARMLAEVEEYDQYLQHEVYGFTLYKNREEIDSCWGYYGGDLAKNGILDNRPGLTEALASESFTTGQARKETTVTYYFD